MSTPSQLGGFERFSKREDVVATLSSITSAVSGLSQDLSDASPDYDSSVVFSYIEGETVTNPLVTLEASNSLWYRHRFRRENIEGRLVPLQGTSLGRVIRNEDPAGFASSDLNAEMPQMLYAEQLTHEGRVVGALQHSFTPFGKANYLQHLLGDTEIAELTDGRRNDVAHAAASIALLHSLAEGRGSLGLLLEHEQGIAPDSCWIRIDVIGSTQYALGPQQTAYEAYQNHCQIFLEELIQDYEQRYLIDQYGIKTGYSDQGDGAYLLLPIPQAYNTYDARVMADYQKYTIDPFIQQMRAGLDAIALQYKDDLTPSPRHAISSAFGNANRNGRGRFVSPVTTALARQKEK